MGGGARERERKRERERGRERRREPERELRGRAVRVVCTEGNEREK